MLKLIVPRDPLSLKENFREVTVEDSQARIRQDIMRSFRNHLSREVTFMCFYMDKGSAGLITNERPFTGAEMVNLFSSVFSASEETILPAVIYALFNLYGPIRVFDVIKAYAKSFDIKGPITVERDPGKSGGTPPPVGDN